MSSPVALVPRASKSNKKKKIGFRPVGKARSTSRSPKPKVPQATPESPPEIVHASEEQEKLENDLNVDKTADDTELVAEQPVAPSKKTTKPPSRKRKQSAGTSISVGIRQTRKSQRETSKQIQTPDIQEDDTPIVTQDDVVVDSSAIETKRKTRSSTTMIVPTAPPAPSGPSEDRLLLQRLAAEKSEEPKLNSFCSGFKRARRSRKAKEVADEGTDENTGRTGNNRNGDQVNADNTTKATRSKSKRKKNPEPSGAPVVQIVDGEIVLQESSLVVAGQRRTIQEVEEEFQDVVEEDAQLAIVGASYNSFVNRKGPQHWTVPETRIFYNALRQLGTDFCSMEAFFENRTRKQLKRKYQVELVKNPELIEMALDPKNKVDIDMNIFKVEVDPKAIELAAKDEPPPYIPNDKEEDQAEEETKEEDEEKKEESPTEPEKATEEMEVVEEDAEEERKLEQAAAAAAERKERKAKGPSIWPSFEDGHEKDTDFPEPTMDDFFHMEDDAMPTEDPTPPAAPPPEKAPAASLSLVPKKAAAKRKKPKFRSKSMKKK